MFRVQNMGIYRSSASLSVSLSPPSLSAGGSSIEGGGRDGDPLSSPDWPARPPVTRATPHRGSVGNNRELSMQFFFYHFENIRRID